jgi:hypothetical protein
MYHDSRNEKLIWNFYLKVWREESDWVTERWKKREYYEDRKDGRRESTTKIERFVWLSVGSIGDPCEHDSKRFGVHKGRWVPRVVERLLTHKESPCFMVLLLQYEAALVWRTCLQTQGNSYLFLHKILPSCQYTRYFYYRVTYLIFFYLEFAFEIHPVILLEELRLLQRISWYLEKINKMYLFYLLPVESF